MEQEKIFQIPEKVLNGIVNVLGSLPYSQVAPIMKEISDVIAPQVQPAPDKDKDN